MKKVFIPVFLVLISTFMFSSEIQKITIENAIEMALNNNDTILLNKEYVNQYKYKLKQNMGFLPSITLEGSKNLDEKLMEIEMPAMFAGGDSTKISLDFTKNYEFALQIVQPLFTGGKILNTFKNAKLDLQLVKEKQRDSRNFLVLNIKKVFFNILVMEELLKVQKEGLLLAENNFNNIKKKYKLGMVSKYDLLRAELNVTSQQPKLLNVKKIINLLVLRFKIMLGIPENKDIVIEGKLDYNKYYLEHSKFIRKSLINRSEITQINIEQRKIKNLLKIAYAQYIPDISLIARYSYRSDLFNLDKENWTNYYTINLGINFPIFSGFKREGQIGELKVLKKVLKIKKKQIDDLTKMQVVDYCLTIEKEFENIQNALKNKKTAEEGVRIADLNYEEGLISVLELNSSYMALTGSKATYFQAVYNYNIAIAELEKISGLKINGGKS